MAVVVDVEPGVVRAADADVAVGVGVVAAVGPRHLARADIHLGLLLCP